MYLESLTIKNYRKFGCKENTICFVKPEVIGHDANESSSAIAPSTTLIIGKNNSGKTTVVNALNLLCQNQQPSTSDFNLSYINELFDLYKQDFDKDNATNFNDLLTPNLEFTLRVKVDFNDDDLITYLAPFISISEGGGGKPVSVFIKIKIALKEVSTFKNSVSSIFKITDSDNKKLDDREYFDLFYSLLSRKTTDTHQEGKLYKTYFMNSIGDQTENFHLNKLINIKEIKANRHLSENVLSNVFNKIVSFQFMNDEASSEKLQKSIGEINNLITGDVGSKSASISQVLNEVESINKVNLNLTGNVTYDAVMKGLIKYNFMDGGDYIPEDQFGLGYINLLNIIGEIIHFVDSYEDKSHFSRINLLFIEEPEAFMHPQMQEFFIKRIDNAVQKALEIANKHSNEKRRLYWSSPT